MKKVLIISLYGNSNFGNKLQNYALSKKISCLSSDLNVSQLKVKNRSKNIIKHLYRDAIDLLGKKTENDKKTMKFEEFNSQYMNYTDFFAVDNSFYMKDIKGYDYYVYGSDQIWNPFSCGTSTLFLGYRTINNIAYSASFGIGDIPKEFSNDYKNGLKNFKYISIREQESKHFVENITKRNDIEVLIDPTMLLNKNEWDEVIKKPENYKEEKYILTCFLGKISAERKEEIQRIATENGCKIINILDKNDKYYACGPSEFLYLEKNAFLICTDSFHSCVFSIIYKRPFIVFEREQEGISSMGSRIDTLLSKFELKNRKFIGKITKENIECNYDNVDNILQLERNKGETFLKKALDIEGEKM